MSSSARRGLFRSGCILIAAERPRGRGRARLFRLRHASRRRNRSPAGTSTCAARMAPACRRASGTVAQGRGGLRRAMRRVPWHLRRGRGPLSQAGRRRRNADRTIGRSRRSAATGRLRRPCGTTLTAPCRCRRRTHCQRDDVYALTAYILNLNDIVPNDFVADRDSLPKVKMPNRDSFIWTDPRPDTMAKPA